MYTRKIVIAVLLSAASFGLSGCFHHQSAYVAEPLPPPISHPPLK